MRTEKRIDILQRRNTRLNTENEELKEKVENLKAEIELYKFASENEYSDVRMLIESLTSLKATMNKAIEDAYIAKDYYESERKKCSEVMKKYRSEMNEFQKALKHVDVK